MGSDRLASGSSHDKGNHCSVYNRVHNSANVFVLFYSVAVVRASLSCRP